MKKRTTNGVQAHKENCGKKLLLGEKNQKTMSLTQYSGGLKKRKKTRIWKAVWSAVHRWIHGGLVWVKVRSWIFVFFGRRPETKKGLG